VASSRARLFTAAFLLSSFACSPQSEKTGAKSGDGAEEKSGEGEKGGDNKTEPAGNLGQISSDTPVPLKDLLGQPPDAVEKVLGEPSATESNRISCIRWVPERVFFACEQELRRYPNEKLTHFIEVDYEDGRAATVAMVGLKSDSSFSLDAVMKAAGLSLPGKPKLTHPRDSVSVWTFWNAQARLLVNEKQYYVRISVVDDEWERSKVEVIVNHPLTPDQESRIKKRG
jgi:hypothetical protein